MEKKRQKKNLDRTNTEHKEVDQSTNDDDDDDSDVDEQLKEKLIPIPTIPVPEYFEGFQKIEIRYVYFNAKVENQIIDACSHRSPFFVISFLFLMLRI